VIELENVMDKLIELLTITDRVGSECNAAMALAHDPEVMKAFQFLERLDALATSYQFAPKDIILLLDPGRTDIEPHALQTVKPAPKKRKPRALKCYQNPNTGEVVQTKGANHKLLKQWKAEYGKAVVESWLR